MELKYLTQLTEEEILELINYCVAKDDMFYNGILVFNEPNYIDEYDERYFLASVWTAESIDVNKNTYAIYEGIFEIKDYEMRVILETSRDYSKELNEFMTERFGLTYVQDLVKKRLQNIQNEFNEVVKTR